MNPLHAELLRLRRRGARRVNSWAIARYLDHGIRTGVLAAAALLKDHGGSLQDAINCLGEGGGALLV